ncbi:KamA family radical SAM protein [Blastochloris viridis]|uniref:Lysine 2,3-aminomutase n=1 Tax=Blastochloris viridis TaxID=1079 RepID=A0A0H5BGE4_BLAVI|nr:lysine 2,3-aminomutase [Blastochloris viridis]ALK10614.1 L-lysine 2,3-aminomutase [Blastochloris viridis]BAR99431.1 lysine 2,3-aminomutase [Blastochloris viridis]CUU43277.1 L-lysine 2,3-aminomutase [Blastochloris viridis]
MATVTLPGSAVSTRYHAIGRSTVSGMPEWQRLDSDLRHGIDIVARVMPFRTNRYVVENLIDWSRVPGDPIFQLVFPQLGMLSKTDFDDVRTLVEAAADVESIGRAVERIRRGLNPHPAGQLTHNTAKIAGRPLPGVQHKYRETVVFFPAQGQTCHAYCTYCFRWAQFVGMPGMRIEARSTADLVAYLKAHPEVTDILITGGDPMIMATRTLRRYIEPLLAPELEHVQNIRIGTKSLAYWPQRFVSDADADDCLRLFGEVAAANRHLAIMGHYTHPIELQPALAREAIRRIRDTGAQVRMQAPLIRHVNDAPEIWSELWRTGVRLGLVPYYMFIERDTGPHSYFAVPLVRAHEIFRRAAASVSGLARSAQGPTMSALPGKIRILGVVTRTELTDRQRTVAFRNGSSSAVDPREQLLVCDFVQARDASLIQTVFFAAFDPGATWLDQMRPAFGQERFSFEQAGERTAPLHAFTECLLD